MMAWSPTWTVLGAVLVALIAYDLLRTVLTVRGGGPITGRVNAGLWALALHAHERFGRPRRLLAAAGPALATLTLLIWLVGLWTGWTAVFCGAAEAVVSAEDKMPADLVERAYFVGYTLTTLGLGDFHAAGSLWRIATVLTAATGLMLFTMAITYIVPIVDSAATMRQLATYLDGLGDDPLDIVARSWDGDPAGGGSGFEPLRTHLAAITPLVAAARQRYLAYPILHYFHSDDPSMAPPVRLAALDETLAVLAHGVAERVRLPRQSIDPLRAQLDGFLATLHEQWIEPADAAPPGYRFDELHERGIPTVAGDDFAAALDARSDHRRRLCGLVHGDGWRWEEVLRRET